MSQPSKERWRLWEVDATPIWSRTTLLCDGYRIVTAWALVKPGRYRLWTYLNGEIRGEWMNAHVEHLEQRFMRPVRRRLFSPGELKAYKALPRAFRPRNFDPNNPWRTLMYSCDWPSPAALRRHLVTVCQCIEILDPETLPP